MQEQNLRSCQAKEKNIYKDKGITVDFSTQTLKAGRDWNEMFQTLKENNIQPRLIYFEKNGYFMTKSILRNS